MGMSGVFVQGGLGLLLRMVLGAAGLGGWCCGCRGLALGMVLGLGMVDVQATHIRYICIE